MVMAVAAGEATVGLAIVIAIYRNKKTPLVDEYDCDAAVMEGIEAFAPLLLVLPMAGFLLTALVGRRLGKQAHWIPVLAILAVWVIAMGLVVPGPDRRGAGHRRRGRRADPRLHDHAWRLDHRPASSTSSSASTSTR